MTKVKNDLQTFLQTLREIWHLSHEKSFKSLFETFFRPVHKGHTRTREGEKLLDDLYHYIIDNIGEQNINRLIAYAKRYVSEESGEAYDHSRTVEAGGHGEGQTRGQTGRENQGCSKLSEKRRVY